MKKIITVLIAIIMTFIFFTMASANLNDGLVAYYPFNGNANDESGNGNDGTVYGATLTDDRFGIADSAYSFDGVDDRINIPNHTISGITLTLNLWVKTDDNTYALISGANPNFNNEYLLYIHSDHGSKLEIYYHDDQGYGGNGFYLTNIITNDNLWHMITIVTKVDETKIYIDGLLEETADYGSESNFDIEGLWIGAEQDCVNGCWNTIQQFNGIIDDVRIYNRALSESEILELYNEGKEGWETAYSTLFDSSSELDLLRQYRDEILSKTTKGKMYKNLLYMNSEEALEVLLDNPELMLEAKYLIEANKDAVSEVLNGNEGVIYSTDEIVSFLDAYAKKSPPALKLLAYMVKRNMLMKQKQGQLFLGFELK